MRNLLLSARLDISESLRARWFLVYSLIFGGIVARFGGEEFVAALPGCNEMRALEAAEAVRQRIAARRIDVDGRTVHLTVSVGVYNLDAYRLENPDDALRRADEALYSAKEEGRNCVRQANPETPAQAGR